MKLAKFKPQLNNRCWNVATTTNLYIYRPTIYNTIPGMRIQYEKVEDCETN